MHISKELKDEFGGGNKEFVFDDMNCWYYCNIVDHPLPTVYNVLLKDVKMCFTWSSNFGNVKSVYIGLV